MPEPAVTFDQRGQQVGTQVNVAGDLVLNLPPPPPEPGRLIGRVPARAAFFTGRAEVLQAIHRALGQPGAAPRALNGMAGVGKTTAAVEYVHRAWSLYSTIAWASADTVESLRSALAGLAPGLGLELPAGATQAVALEAVGRWFATHADWLVVADNVEDFAAVREVLPVGATGRILFTTRREDAGAGVVPIRLDRMDEATGALLLLRRAGHVGPEAGLERAETDWREGALELSRAFDGLPLALDQAGAYLASRHKTPAQYLDLYETRRKELLGRGGDADHQTVAVTFDLALRQTEAIGGFGSAAAEVVRLAAFLGPDAIPDEVFRMGVAEEPLRSLATDDLDWGDVVEAATRYSLVGRDPGLGGFVLHRLVAAVVRDGMDDEARRTWMERAIRAVDGGFPKTDYAGWEACERFLPHALTLWKTISTQELALPEASRILDKAAIYLERRARYAESEALFREAVAAERRVDAADHAALATRLNNLGTLFLATGRYEEAATTLEEVLAMEERLPDGGDFDPAAHLGNLASAYFYQDRPDRATLAEPLWRKALELTEAKPDLDTSDLGIRLSSLALALQELGRFEEAEALRLRCLEVGKGLERTPEYGVWTTNLGSMYLRWGRLDKAAPVLRQAVALVDAIYPEGHPDCAGPRFWLARLLYERGDLAASRDLFRETWEMEERFVGPDHPDTVSAREAFELVQRRLEPA